MTDAADPLTRRFCRDCGHWEHDPGSCDALGHRFAGGLPIVGVCSCEVHDDQRPITQAAEAADPWLRPCAMCDSPDGRKWHRPSCAAADPLDVERLARALESAWMDGAWSRGPKHAATVVAAAYAEAEK